MGHGIISSCEHGYQGRYIECHELGNICKNFNPDCDKCKKCDHYDYTCSNYQRTLAFLFSAEAYWVEDRTQKDKSNCHIFLGAKNEHGRQCINDVLAEANITGFYGQPRIDLPLLLSLPPEDVWVTTACVAFWKYDSVDEIVKTLQNHFKKNFFLEVQYHNTEKQKELNKHILDLHNDLKIPLIMGCDSHYIFSEQAQDRKDFLVSKEINYPDEEGWYLDYPDGDTAYKRFAKQSVLSDSEICDAMDNTNTFLDVERYDNPCFSTKIKMPELPSMKGYSQEEKDLVYKKLIHDWWISYRDDVPKEKWEMYVDAISEEIQTVEDTKMSDYFLVNHEIIKKGKENGGNLTMTGRGSAVSFLTNKALGFTEVDRLSASVKMYPERFMSKTRILKSGSLPDIDFNVDKIEPFAQAQKDVLGDDHAYPMVSYGTLKKSAAWKLYAKAKGIDFETANAVSDQIKKYEKAYKHADDDEKDDIDVNNYISSEYQEIYSKSVDYQNVVSSWSIAPCSHLLYQGSIRKEIGLCKVKDHLCCLMDGHWAEKYHFLKNDILKVIVVDLIYRTFKKLGSKPFPVEDLLNKCQPDSSCWDIYKKGITLGINQCEKSGTSQRVKKYNPTNISELCAFVAAIRPGFKSMYSIFESRKPFKYGIKAFDDLIQTREMPNSFVLYQEMEMAALHYAGIPMDECYTAIKNIAKKRVEKVLAYKEQFVKGFSESIIKEGKPKEKADELSSKLWQIIEDSSQYSFNASHAYCVAIDSLYCAWLKINHPLEFYSTYLTLQSEKKDKDKMQLARKEAHDYFKIKFPAFKFGQDNRTVSFNADSNSIENSLSSIKGFGESIGATLYAVSTKHYDFFVDLLMELHSKSMGAKKVEPLIKIGYFSDFGNDKELLKINKILVELKYGDRSTIKKEGIDQTFEKLAQPYVNGKTKTGNEAKSYTIIDFTGLIHTCENFIFDSHISDFNIKEKIANQNEILGYIDLKTNKPEDLKKLIVLSVFPAINHSTNVEFAKNVNTCSVGSGKQSKWTLYLSKYNDSPIDKGNIIQVKNWSKNKKGYFVLYDYNIIA